MCVRFLDTALSCSPCGTRTVPRSPEGVTIHHPKKRTAPGRKGASHSLHTALAQARRNGGEPPRSHMKPGGTGLHCHPDRGQTRLLARPSCVSAGVNRGLGRIWRSVRGPWVYPDQATSGRGDQLVHHFLDRQRQPFGDDLIPCVPCLQSLDQHQ